MKIQKLLPLTILLIGGLFISCSKDDSGDDTNQTPPTPQPSPIAISSISSEFVITGDVLEITGTNFINKDYPTKISLNGIEISPKELSNNKIQLSITETLKAGNNTLMIQIEKISRSISFFVMAKGWNKIDTFGQKDVITSSVFDDSNSIFSFVDDEIASNIFFGTARKLVGKSTGYQETKVKQAGSYGAFRMFDEKRGVLTNSSWCFFTDNGFETQNQVNVESTFSPEIDGLRIGYWDSKSCIVTTLISSQIYINGLTAIKNDPPVWALKIEHNGVSARLVVKAFGKSTSNEKFYQLGMLYDPKKYGSNNSKNVVLESETGYTNWIVKDTVSNINPNLKWSSYKFLNINKILAIGRDDKTLQESNDLLKTWRVIKTDVSAIFLRTETQWYIQSGDKLYVTADAGQTWNLELELPADSVINDISFSKSKIIVSGNKGLLYLKIE